MNTYIQSLTTRKQTLQALYNDPKTPTPERHNIGVRLEEVELMIAAEEGKTQTVVAAPRNILTELEQHLRVARQYQANGCPIDFTPIEGNSVDVNAMLEQLHKLQVREWREASKLGIKDQIGAWIRNFIALLTDEEYARFKAWQAKQHVERRKEEEAAKQARRDRGETVEEDTWDF